MHIVPLYVRSGNAGHDDGHLARLDYGLQSRSNIHVHVRPLRCAPDTPVSRIGLSHMCPVRGQPTPEPTPQQ